MKGLYSIPYPGLVLFLNICIIGAIIGAYFGGHLNTWDDFIMIPIGGIFLNIFLHVCINLAKD